jgi:prepilin-type N-terminal cleavage/methylation domain-containing protein
MFIHKQNESGFTILEVIVALVIVGISVTMFVRLLGNSSMLRARVNEYDERLDIAISKTEQSFLGLLSGGSVQGGDGNKMLQGKIGDKDINWRIEEKSDNSFSQQEREAFFYTVSVDGIDISSAGIR